MPEGDSFIITTPGTGAAEGSSEPESAVGSGLSPDGRSAGRRVLSGRGAVAPIAARPINPVGYDPAEAKYEIVDADGLVLTLPLVGLNSSVAIAHMLDLFARGDGLCLLHLTETIGGRCVACMSGWARHLLSAALR